MMWRTVVVMLLGLLLASEAVALIRVTTFRPLTEAEVGAVKDRIFSRHPNANIDASTMAIVEGENGKKWASVNFESERRRINERFCGAVSDSLHGELSDSHELFWEALESDYTPNLLYEQRNVTTCYSADSTRSVGVDKKVRVDTVAWVLDNEDRVWNEFLIMAVRQYGAALGLPAVVPELISIELKDSGNITATFFDGDQIFWCRIKLGYRSLDCHGGSYRHAVNLHFGMSAENALTKSSVTLVNAIK